MNGVLAPESGIFTRHHESRLISPTTLLIVGGKTMSIIGATMFNIVATMIIIV